jgi:drug/metabolite transporter (DMT)-like permease
MKYFTLTTISVFYNIAPFCTLFFAACFLGETIQRSDIYAVCLCFISVLIITYGMAQNSEHVQKAKMTAAEYARLDHFSVLAFICLVSAPIMKAAQNIILRAVRKINSKTMSCYSNPFLGLCCGIYLLASGKGMDFTNLLWEDHTLLILFIFLGSINVFQQVLKVMAHQNEEASKLAVFGYL